MHDGQKLVRPSKDRFECPRCSAVFKVVENIPRFLPDRIDPAQAQVTDAFSFKWSRDEWGFKPNHIELMRSFFHDRFGFSKEEDLASLFGDKVVLHAGIGSGHDIFGKTMVLAVFPELYAIIAFAATFLISMSL